MPTVRKPGQPNPYGYAWRALCIRAYERYGYHCYRCGQRINPDLPATHRLSKTIDHIHPVEIAGSAVPHIDDVRPMHRACNTHKRNEHARGRARTRTWSSRTW